MTLKAVVDTQLDGDVTRVRSWTARFAGVVYPGETLRLRMWRQRGEGGSGTGGASAVRLTATAVERADASVLTGVVALS